MCGLAAIVSRRNNGEINPGQLVDMQDSMIHRGPDGRDIWLGDGVGLAHVRLAIIDLSNGAQPMGNEDGSIQIVFNGEIYNYRELRESLSSRHDFKTMSDTEVIIHLYEEKGEDCLQELNGMFSFVIWDENQKKVFAARDRLGIKPLYWAMNDQYLLFSSEIKALVKTGLIQAECDHQGLEQYLTFQFFLGSKTLFRGINRLEPGNCLSWNRDQNELQIRRFWDLEYEVDLHHTDQYFIDKLRWLLEDSVKLQLRSDVPVGSHLSGGIDSSTITTLAASQYEGQLHTFTGGFRDGPQYDETAYAREVALASGTSHHEIYPDARDFIDTMPWLIHLMDEPSAGPGLFPQFFVSSLARDNVKVVLGGQGGDEIFGGYARYLVAYLEQVLKGAIHGTQEEGKHIVTWENIFPNLGLLKQYTPMLQNFWSGGLFEPMDRRYFRLIDRLGGSQDIFSGDIWNDTSKERVFASFQEVFNRPSTLSYFNKMTHFDIRTFLPALLQVEDRTSMGVSLESRVPLLDHRLVELVASMPPAMRFWGGSAKRVFRQAVKDLLPQKVFTRQDKMGFPVPLSEWSKGPLKDFLHDILLSSGAKQRGIYNPASLEKILDKEKAFGRKVWGLLCLELWYREYIDGKEPEVPSQIKVLQNRIMSRQSFAQQSRSSTKNAAA